MDYLICFLRNAFRIELFLQISLELDQIVDVLVGSPEIDASVFISGKSRAWCQFAQNCWFSPETTVLG